MTERPSFWRIVFSRVTGLPVQASGRWTVGVAVASALAAASTIVGPVAGWLPPASSWPATAAAVVFLVALALFGRIAARILVASGGTGSPRWHAVRMLADAREDAARRLERRNEPPHHLDYQAPIRWRDETAARIRAALGDREADAFLAIKEEDAADLDLTKHQQIVSFYTLHTDHLEELATRVQAGELEIRP